MRRFASVAIAATTLVAATACYRLPLRIRENDASGYEEVGVPLIEAVEYTPTGRDLRVMLEAPGYVTVIIVDPDRGATVRFRRGDVKSQYAEKGVHRYPLDRLSSPMTLADLIPTQRFNGASGLGRPAIRPRLLPADSFDPRLNTNTDAVDSARRELRLDSRAVRGASGAVTSTHVVVLVTEQPLDLVGVATRLARGTLDPAQVAQDAADVVEGGRWMAAMAPLRGT
jgi:hypothetical protein